MVGMAYASVPLYSWFCRTTGFGGVPQVASIAPAQVSDRKITVRFDANVGPGLPWRFEPERTSMEVRLGEVVAVFYKVTNVSERGTGGQAGYNVAAAAGRGGFHENKLFLLHRAAPCASRDARDGGRILCGCGADAGFRPGRPQHYYVVLYILSATPGAAGRSGPRKPGGRRAQDIITRHQTGAA